MYSTEQILQSIKYYLHGTSKQTKRVVLSKLLDAYCIQCGGAKQAKRCPKCPTG